MFDPKLIDDLSARLQSALPEGLRSLQQDLDRNLRAAVQATLGRLDLVTREEFEIQTKVLARTRAQLDALNLRVAQLEAEILGHVSSGAPDKTAAAQSGTEAAEQDMDGG